MNDLPTSDAPVATPLDVNDLMRTVHELEQRVHVLENAVAALPDTRQLEERITDRVVTRIPKPAPPAAPPEPSLHDIALPIPSAATVTTVVQSSWTVWELYSDARTMFWMLLDRRYTKAWLTRVLILVLLALIVTTFLWVPLSSVSVVGYVIEKVVVVLLTLLMGLVMMRETRRYKEWRAGAR